MNLLQYLEHIKAPPANMPGGMPYGGDPMKMLGAHMPDIANPLAPPPAIAQSMPNFQNPTMPPKGPFGGVK